VQSWPHRYDNRWVSVVSLLDIMRALPSRLITNKGTPYPSESHQLINFNSNSF